MTGLSRLEAEQAFSRLSQPELRELESWPRGWWEFALAAVLWLGARPVVGPVRGRSS